MHPRGSPRANSERWASSAKAPGPPAHPPQRSQFQAFLLHWFLPGVWENRGRRGQLPPSLPFCRDPNPVQDAAVLPYSPWEERTKKKPQDWQISAQRGVGTSCDREGLDQSNVGLPGGDSQPSHPSLVLLGALRGFRARPGAPRAPPSPVSLPRGSVSRWIPVAGLRGGCNETWG